MGSDPLTEVLRRDDTDWAREHLEGDVVGWLTTVAADGMPQSSVIAFLWEDATILTYSVPDKPKLRNIGRSPLVSFHLQSDPFGDHMLIIEGPAEEDPAVPPWNINPAFQAKYREPLAHWGLDENETARAYSVPLRIRPRRVRLA